MLWRWELGRWSMVLWRWELGRWPVVFWRWTWIKFRCWGWAIIISEVGSLSSLAGFAKVTPLKKLIKLKAMS